MAQKGHNWWRITSVWLWYWNQSLIIPMEASRRTKTKKSTSSSVKCEGFAHCLFRLQWRVASWILPWMCLCVSFCPKTKTVITPQPPYSTVLISSDFFLFPKLEIPMKGNRFVTIEEIKEKSKQELLAIPKWAFQKCFEDWKKRWHKCVISEGGRVTLKGTR